MTVVESPPHEPSPFRGGWLWATLAVALGLVLLAGLGFWQLQRLSQRRAANAFLLGRLQAAPLQIDGAGLDPEASDLRRAVVTGTYDFAQEIILRNRTYNELPGVHVLTPLRIDGSDAAVLVDRGWLPYEVSANDRRAQFHAPTGKVEVRGILRQAQVYRGGLAPADPPLGPSRSRLDAWFRVGIPRIQEQIPYKLLPVYLEEDSAEAANTGTGADAARRFPRPAPDIQLSEGSHLAYAVQFFSFAAILLGGYVLLYQRRRNPD